jgi:hypothetical protein
VRQLKNPDHDLHLRERSHGDELLIDVLPNGTALIQVGLRFPDSSEPQWNGIKVSRKAVVMIAKLLKTRKR